MRYVERMEEKNTNEQKNNIKDKPKKQSQSQKAMSGMQGGIIFALLLGVIAWGIYHFYQYFLINTLTTYLGFYHNL